MLAKADLLTHAKAAVDRTARSLSDMRTRLQLATAMGRQHRLLIDGALHDLSRRHEALADLYEAMTSAPADEIPACWQRFFACYDDYLEAVRDIRSRLIQDENDPSGQDDSPANAPAHRRAGRRK